MPADYFDRARRADLRSQLERGIPMSEITIRGLLDTADRLESELEIVTDEAARATVSLKRVREIVCPVPKS